MSLRLILDIVNHPANKQGRLKAVIRALNWQLYKRFTGRSLDLDYHGLKLRCYPDSHSASRAIYFNALPDYREMRFVMDYLRPGDRFIDAGANVGLYTLLAASIVGPTGHIDAFEPQENVSRVLNETVQLNDLKNVAVHTVALADIEGYMNFDETGDDCTAHISVAPSSDSHSQVETCRLDKRLANVPYALAKFDIEGFEPRAIHGAKLLIEAGHLPVMLIEMAGYSKRIGVTTSAFIKELDVLGYFTAVYCPATRTLHETTRPWEIPVDNVVAVSRKHAASVSRRLNWRPSNV